MTVTISAAKRAAVLARDHHRCVFCGCRTFLTLDHVYPKSLGGTDAIDNLQTVCQPCNARKGDGWYGPRRPPYTDPRELE